MSDWKRKADETAADPRLVRIWAAWFLGGIALLAAACWLARDLIAAVPLWLAIPLGAAAATVVNVAAWTARDRAAKEKP